MQGVVLGNKLTLVIMLDAVVELFCLLPGVLDVGLLFGLDVLEFLVEKLLVIPAFFDDLVEMVFLIFDRFLQFGSNNPLLSVRPLHKVPLHGLNPGLLLALPLQLEPHVVLFP